MATPARDLLENKRRMHKYRTLMVFCTIGSLL